MQSYVTTCYPLVPLAPGRICYRLLQAGGASGIEFAMALGPAGEINRFAGDAGLQRKPEVVAALKETLSRLRPADRRERNA